jgi:hypothetical protein
MTYFQNNLLYYDKLPVNHANCYSSSPKTSFNFSKAIDRVDISDYVDINQFWNS